jgi:hypothetical protein
VICELKKGKIAQIGRFFAFFLHVCKKKLIFAAKLRINYAYRYYHMLSGVAGVTVEPLHHTASKDQGSL